MELKLNKSLSIPILLVAGEVSERESQILIAGLTKIKNEEKKAIIIDMSRCRFSGKARDAIFEIHLRFLASQLPLVAVGADEQLCHVKDLKSAVEMAQSPAKFVLEETRVLENMENYVKARKEYLAKECQMAAEDGSLAIAEKENEKLLGILNGMEGQVDSEESEALAQEIPIALVQNLESLKLRCEEELADLGIIPGNSNA